MQGKILEKQNAIATGILKAVLPDIQKDFHRSINLIQRNLPSLVTEIVQSSPEYGSLIGGQLMLELGIPDASSKIAGLIRKWSSNIRYKIKHPAVVGHKIKGSFSAELFKADFSDVLGTSDAMVQATRYELPWLNWLVLQGNIPLVREHTIEFVNTPRSRTGGALMTNTGGSWSVPPSYAGTIADNWITRSIENHSHLIRQLLERSFR